LSEYFEGLAIIRELDRTDKQDASHDRKFVINKDDRMYDRKVLLRDHGVKGNKFDNPILLGFGRRFWQVMDRK